MTSWGQVPQATIFLSAGEAPEVTPLSPPVCGVCVSVMGVSVLMTVHLWGCEWSDGMSLSLIHI